MGRAADRRAARHNGTRSFPEARRKLPGARSPVHPAVMELPLFDVVVVGGGAAGLSAALVLGRARRKVAVIDAGAPRNAPAAHMQGFLSRDGMPPAEFLDIGRSEVTGYGVDIIDGMVTAIEPGFVVRLDAGESL